MGPLSFIKQYITKPRSVGAVMPSSKHLAAKMICPINFHDARSIVEYGPGTGVFTEQLLRHRNPQTVVLLLETNTTFIDILKSKYENEPNLYIINESAENIGQYLAMHNIPQADYILSGLPFASIPQDISTRILSETKKYLSQNGSFITFQYTMLKKELIRQFFNSIDITHEIRNIPPAYVLCCKNNI